MNSRQGQSAATPGKELALSRLLGWNMRLVKNIADKWGKAPHYFHIDLHAGCGYNAMRKTQDSRSGTTGSPIVFLMSAEGMGIPYSALFIEMNQESALCLAENRRVYPDRDAYVICGQNESVLEAVPYWIRSNGVAPSKAFGSVFIDPNGPTEIPWYALAQVLKQCERLDVIFNFPAGGMKRIPDDHEARIGIDEVPRWLNKAHWIVEKAPRSVHQFILLMGRNYEFGDYRSVGFVKMHSPEGRFVIATVSKTAAERQAEIQLSLF